ncbi:MAG: tetratricopeptide repeat protein [Vicinamibacterales bacterium]
MRGIAVAVVLGAALVVGAAPAAAQMELGVIKGRIVDDAGKPLQGVNIRLVNVERGREVTITTDRDGRFYRRGLQAGEYQVKVNHEGFQPIDDTIRLVAGTDRNFDFSLAKAAAAGSKEFQEGVAAFNAKDFAQAAAKFEAAVAASPTVAPLYVNLALAYFQLKRPAEAVGALEKAASLAPGDASIQFQLGSAYVDTQDYDKAVAALQKGLAAKPDLARDGLAAEATATLGAVLFAQGKVAEAEAEFQRVLAARPDSAAGLLGMGKVYFSRSDVAKALELFERVVSAHPGTPEAAQAETFVKELKKGDR